MGNHSHYGNTPHVPRNSEKSEALYQKIKGEYNAKIQAEVDREAKLKEASDWKSGEEERTRVRKLLKFKKRRAARRKFAERWLGIKYEPQGKLEQLNREAMKKEYGEDFYSGKKNKKEKKKKKVFLGFLGGKKKKKKKKKS